MREMFVANCKFCMHEYHVIVGMSFGIRVVLLVLGSFPLCIQIFHRWDCFGVEI